MPPRSARPAARWTSPPRRSPSTANAAPRAVCAAPPAVRLRRAPIAVGPQELAPKAGGATIAVRATGTVEGSADLYVTAVAGATACPVPYDDVTEPLAFDATPAGTASHVTGDFDLTFQSHDLLAF